MTCPLCEVATKDWDGDDRKCAYPVPGNPDTEFSEGNWNCATMNRLRDMVEERGTKAYCEDQTLGVLPWEDGEFLVLSWHKNRGRTEDIRLLTGHSAMRPTLEDLLWMSPVHFGANLPEVK